MRAESKGAIIIAIAAAAATAVMWMWLRPTADQPAGYAAPRTADGRHDLNGIWQALNTANYDIEAHDARPALALIPVSLVPCLSQPAGEVYFAWALVLGTAQLACAAWFLMRLDESSARRLLLASLVYLPAMMGLLVLGPLV